MFDRNFVLIGAGLGLVLIVGAAWAARQVAPAAAAAVNAVNPLNPQNVFAQTTNQTAAIVTGDPLDTLGTALWKWLNPELAARERGITDPVYVDQPGRRGATGTW